MSEYVYLDGQLVRGEDAGISPFDAGFLHGAGLFETMRAKNGKVFRLGRHLSRLTESARVLSIPFAIGEGQLTEMVGEVLEANGLKEARVRVTVTRGDTSLATAEDPVPPVTFLVTAAAFQEYPAAMYEEGMTVVVSTYKQNPESPLTGHKTTCYLDRLIALREAAALKAQEALWFTAHTNFLAEGSMSNVFVVDQGGVLCTPPLVVEGKANQRLCLPGVVREAVMEVAMGLGMMPAERMLTIHDLLGAKEVFVTGSMRGVMGVTRVERHVVGEGKVGEVTRRLRGGYEGLLLSETT